METIYTSLENYEDDAHLNNIIQMDTAAEWDDDDDYDLDYDPNEMYYALANDK